MTFRRDDSRGAL